MPKLAIPPPLFLETQKNATAYTERSESTSQHISSPCLASPPPPLQALLWLLVVADVLLMVADVLLMVANGLDVFAMSSISSGAIGSLLRCALLKPNCTSRWNGPVARRRS